MSAAKDVKELSISALLCMGFSVYAYRDENGEVQIESVRSVIGLPTPQEIYESMSEIDFDALDQAFAEVERAK